MRGFMQDKKIKAKANYKDLVKGEVYTFVNRQIHHNKDYYLVNISNKQVLYRTKHFEVV